MMKHLNRLSYKINGVWFSFSSWEWMTQENKQTKYSSCGLRGLGYFQEDIFIFIMPPWGDELWANTSWRKFFKSCPGDGWNHSELENWLQVSVENHWFLHYVGLQVPDHWKYLVGSVKYFSGAQQVVWTWNFQEIVGFEVRRGHENFGLIVGIFYKRTPKDINTLSKKSVSVFNIYSKVVCMS